MDPEFHFGASRVKVTCHKKKINIGVGCGRLWKTLGIVTRITDGSFKILGWIRDCVRNQWGSSRLSPNFVSPNFANGESALHSPRQCVLEKTFSSSGCCNFAFRVLQFLPCAFESKDNSRRKGGA